MELSEWNERYRSRSRAGEDFATCPSALVERTARAITPGRALDLACGFGRNALWLARQGWQVTAVDGARAAIDALQERVRGEGLAVETCVANLERSEYVIAPHSWDLICICYYLQRDLFPRAIRGLLPGGTIISIVHIAGEGETETSRRLLPGQLVSYFGDLEILHQFEGAPSDANHQRAVAEVVAQKPLGAAR